MITAAYDFSWACECGTAIKVNMLGSDTYTMNLIRSVVAEHERQGHEETHPTVARDLRDKERRRLRRTG